MGGMDAKTRKCQVYELQRVALINVNYYGCRITRLTWINRGFQTVAALAASGTIASVVRDVPADWKWLSIGVSLIAAASAAIVAVWNFSDALARLERLHSSYKLLYHSAETLAKQTIGSDALTPEQEAAASILELQLAALGPQDEIDPDQETMRKARVSALRALPDSYYDPEHVEAHPGPATAA